MALPMRLLGGRRSRENPTLESYIFSSVAASPFLWSAEFQVISLLTLFVPKALDICRRFEILYSVFQADVTETRNKMLVTLVIMAQERHC